MGNKKFIIENFSIKLNHNKWTYKIELHGEWQLQLCGLSLWSKLIVHWLNESKTINL